MAVVENGKGSNFHKKTQDQFYSDSKKMMISPQFQPIRQKTNTYMTS